MGAPNESLLRLQRGIDTVRLAVRQGWYCQESTNTETLSETRTAKRSNRLLYLICDAVADLRPQGAVNQIVIRRNGDGRLS